MSLGPTQIPLNFKSDLDNRLGTKNLGLLFANYLVSFSGICKYYWWDLPEKNQKMGLGLT